LILEHGPLILPFRKIYLQLLQLVNKYPNVGHWAAIIAVLHTIGLDNNDKWKLYYSKCSSKVCVLKNLLHNYLCIICYVYFPLCKCITETMERNMMTAWEIHCLLGKADMLRHRSGQARAQAISEYTFCIYIYNKSFYTYCC